MVMVRRHGNKTTVVSIVRYLLLWLFLGGGLAANAAQIQLNISSTPVYVDEAFELQFSTTESTSGAPDFTPLSQDFELLTQQKSSQISNVNGTRQQKISWVVKLMARRAGAVTIPPIQFGQDVSDPLSIQIEAAKGSDKNGREMFLMVDASPQQPYVQAQLIYTWRFYRRADVVLNGASLSEPQLDNAIRLQLGENRQFNAEVDGVSYVVTEGRYAFFPQQSGRMMIAPLVLTAEVSDQAQSMNRFFRFGRSTTRRVSSKELTVAVQAVPVGFKGRQWLAASQLELSEKWSDDGLQIAVGQALTRTLTVRATGLLKSQLPELNADLQDKRLNSYADQAVLAEKPFSSGVSALREQKIAIIATQAGVYTLPEIEIPWFNTQTETMEIARIPEHRLTVVAAGSSDRNTTDTDTDMALNAGEVRYDDASQKLLFWQVLSAVLLLIALFLVYLLWRLRQPQMLHTNVKKQQVDTQNTAGITRKLQKACFADQPHAARQALLEWSRVYYNESTLAAIYPYCQPALHEQIQQLERVLYAPDQEEWKGHELWQAFKQNTAIETSVNKDGPLLDLYPQR